MAVIGAAMIVAGVMALLGFWPNLDLRQHRVSQIADDRRSSLTLCGLGICGALFLLFLASMHAYSVASSRSNLPPPKRERAGTFRLLDGKN